MSSQKMEGKAPLTPFLGLSSVVERYPFVLCDVWGVLHNGVVAFEGAVKALSAYRQLGGRVLLLTNAPMPPFMVVQRLRSLGVCEDEICEDIVTSGSLVQDFLSQHVGERVFPWGPLKDRPLYEGQNITLTSLEEADFIVCTGSLGDDLGGEETLQGEVKQLERALHRQLPFVCANPDLSVRVGHREALCAGLLAKIYEERGGNVLWYGKPHSPVYDTCLRKLSEIVGYPVEKTKVLAIGDGMGTDILGAFQYGIDSLWVTEGVHGAALSEKDMAKILSLHGVSPTYYAPSLF